MSTERRLACNAAACAIRCGQLGKAVELLEEGRSIFWSGALQLCTPLDELLHVAPELLHKLQNISRTLGQASLRDVSRKLSDATQRVRSMEQEAIRYRHLNDEWLATGLRRIFTSKLICQAAKCCIPWPSCSSQSLEFRFDVLVVNASGIEHIALLEVTTEFVVKLAHLVQDASGAVAIPAKSKIQNLIQQTTFPPDAESHIPLGTTLKADDTCPGNIVDIDC
jgi:hypothetical protein